MTGFGTGNSDSEMLTRFKTMVNDGVNQKDDYDSAEAKRQKAKQAAASVVHRSKVFKIDQKEPVKELKARHEYLIGLQET